MLRATHGMLSGNGSFSMFLESSVSLFGEYKYSKYDSNLRQVLQGPQIVGLVAKKTFILTSSVTSGLHQLDISES